MTDWVIIAVLLIFLALIVLGRPVAFALGISGLVGIVLLRGFAVGGDTLATLPYTISAKQSLMVIPLFILLGALAYKAGLASDVYNLIYRYSGKRKSAVANAAILSGAGFAAVTGSSVAAVAALAPNLLPEMESRGFRRKFAAGLIATTGTLGILIPPSITMVLYGIMTGESIGAVLLAGIIPGAISVVIYCLGAMALIRWGNALEKTGADSSQDDVRSSGTNTVSGAKNTATVGWLASPWVGAAMTAVIFLVVMGGIFFGIYTVTESAAIGTVVAAIMFVVRTFKAPKDSTKAFVASVKETVSTTGMLFFIFLGGAIFSYFLVIAGVPRAVVGYVTSLSLEPWMVVVLILLIMVPLGMVLDGISILVIVVPLAYPIVTGLGFDGIWFGILVVKVIELGLLTPPVGLNAYVLSGTIPNLPVGEVFRGLLPWYFIEALTIVVLFLIPELSLFLPSLMMN